MLNTRKHDILETDPVSEMSCFLVFSILDGRHSPETQHFLTLAGTSRLAVTVNIVLDKKGK
jgi:hypothetical protein